MKETINLGSGNSGLTFTSYNGEQVQINGGTPLATKWANYKVAGGASILNTRRGREQEGKERRERRSDEKVVVFPWLQNGQTTKWQVVQVS